MAKERKDFEKLVVDEEYLMNIMSGEEPLPAKNTTVQNDRAEIKPTERGRSKGSKKANYQDTFLVNRFPSGRTGKVVYIRNEYHERLLRIVQLTREDKVTLYSYIDNILEHHFEEFGDEITAYFNEKFKPIL